jgi:ABC-type oligopeptide transport system substrate-binding subunit
VPRPVAPTDLFALQQKFDYQLSIDDWTMDIPDPDEYAAYSLSPIGGTYAFYTGFKDPRMTALVKRAQTTFSPVARRTLYAEIQRLADADVPQIPALLLAARLRRRSERARLPRLSARELSP